MRELLTAIGSVILALFIAGSIGLIDFTICAKAVGQCPKEPTE